MVAAVTTRWAAVVDTIKADHRSDSTTTAVVAVSWTFLISSNQWVLGSFGGQSNYGGGGGNYQGGGGQFGGDRGGGMDGGARGPRYSGMLGGKALHTSQTQMRDEDVVPIPDEGASVVHIDTGTCIM